MADVIAVLDLCRLAGSGAQGNAPLHSFSSTVLQFATPLKERSSPTVFIARGESGGFRFESRARDRDAGARGSIGWAHGIGQRGASFRGRFSRRRSKPWLARACRAGRALCLGGVAIFIVAYSAGLRRGGEIKASPETAVAKSKPPRDNESTSPPNEPVETVSSVPETPAAAALDTAADLPKKEPETPPAEASAPVPARPAITDTEKPKPKVVMVPTCNVAPVFSEHRKAVRSIAVRADGKVALTASADRTARAWEVATGKQIFEIKHPSEVLAAAISPDGRSAVTATKGLRNSNGHLRRWNMSTGEQIHGSPMPELHVGPIPAVAFLPDGRGLTGGEDGQLILWHFDTGRLIGTLGHQKGAIHRHTMAIFPHGRRGLDRR